MPGERGERYGGQGRERVVPGQDEHHRLVPHRLLLQAAGDPGGESGEPAEGGVETSGEDLGGGVREPALVPDHEFPLGDEGAGPRDDPFTHQTGRVDVHEQGLGAPPRGEQRVLRLDDPPRVGHQPQPGRGEFHVPRTAYEQLLPQLPLQTPHIPAEGLLRHVAARGGPGEVQFLGHGEETAQQPGLDVLSSTHRATVPGPGARLTTGSGERGPKRCWTVPGGAPEPVTMPKNASPARISAPAPAGFLHPYRDLFARPGALGFTAGGLLARLPMGMFGVSAVLMISASRGSYALAGAVTATGLAATAVAGPWTARLVDRHGQARIALPATVLAAFGSLSLVLCVRYGAPTWTLFASYAATATTPNTGGMARARWAHLLKEDAAARHTATSFEQAADELCFMLGPVLAALLCTAWFPQAGTLAGVVLLVAGMALFTARRRTAPPPSPRSTAPLPVRSLAPLLACFLGTGVVFGALEVSTVAHAGGAAGLVLGLQAAGSCVAGLVLGTLDRRPSLPACLATMAALLTLPLTVAATTRSPWALAPVVLLAGMATAPTMITAMTRVQHRTPPGRLNEGMTLAVTAILTGSATGSALAGLIADHLTPSLGYGVAVAGAVGAWGSSWLGRR